MLALQVSVFAIAAWLGAHLLARSPHKPAVRWAAAGAFGYAFGIAGIAVVGTTDPVPSWSAWAGAALAIPMVAWPQVLLSMAGPVARWRHFVPWLVGVAAIAVGFTPGGPAALFAVLTLAPLLTFALTFRHIHHCGARTSTFVAALLFGLGVSAAVYAAGLLPLWLILPLLGVDLILLTLSVAIADAFEEGTTLRADMARSAIFSGLAGIGFGGQVGLVILATGSSTATTALLFGVVAAAVTGQALHGALNRAVDGLAFAGRPDTIRERENLRDAADSLARRREPADFAMPGEAEFNRMVRRALSNYAHLGRLVASPLTGLPLIGERLAARGSGDQPLERAAELKALLREGIERLRPVPGEFATTDEWRFFNAVHYPFVVGLRPYSSRARHEGLSADAAAALKWFRAGVPERTLHNWQNQAAALIAEDLRARTEANSAASGSAVPVPGSASRAV